MMAHMEVARSHADKHKITITAVKKSASCSHGWLRWTVQCIFGAITIISFVLILYMAMTNNSNRLKEDRCNVYGCRIICHNVPFYDSYFQNLAIAVQKAESSCPSNIIVVLNEPMFSNYTLPRQLLSRLRQNIYIDELEIVGGNMKYIAPNSFAERAASRIQRLHFEKVKISDWEPDSFIGLKNLKEICIEHSYIFDINKNALQAVENTLTSLSIKDSGYWYPTNLTGSSNLETLRNVYLSYNNFNNILNKNSFKTLKRCRVLYLDSCRINAIGPGTFDYLDEIEKLFLNNNFLIILPEGIFSRMMAKNPRPRINLEDNLWYCDCYLSELRNWSRSGILLVDALCYYPSSLRDYPFSLLEFECGNETRIKHINLDLEPPVDIDTIVAGKCNDGQEHGRTSFILSNKFLGCSDAQHKSAKYSQHALHVLPPLSIPIHRPKIDRLIEARFAIQADHLSMIEITSVQSPASRNYGLLWYQTDCPEEINCVSILPRNLRVYNLENNVEYTFCPLLLRTGEIDSDQCLNHTLGVTKEMTVKRMLQITVYICTAIIGTLVGACILYTVIRKFPHLLKGSDRILFVKHKNVEALVLPPKVPLRESASLENKNSPVKIDSIFTLPDYKVAQSTFFRMKSTRSNKSAAPSYISAMQPTEEQLAEWRLRHHFDNNLTITSVGFDVPYSLLFDKESMYCSIGQTNNSTDYESLNNK